jgi:hypothetical protein
MAMYQEVRDIVCTSSKLYPQYIKGKHYRGNFRLYCWDVVDEYNNMMNYGIDKFNEYFTELEELRDNKIKTILDNEVQTNIQHR